MLQSFATELARMLATVDERIFKRAVKIADRARKNGGRVYFIGNGGSAAIASHMAIDWANKGGFDTQDLNNPAALTCLANDYGYEKVFFQQLKDIRENDDLLVAISSSGESRNIVLPAMLASNRDANLIALSGFELDNALNQVKSFASFHIPSDNYAIVENAHMAILHAMLEELK